LEVDCRLDVSPLSFSRRVLLLVPSRHSCCVILRIVDRSIVATFVMPMPCVPFKTFSVGGGDPREAFERRGIKYDSYLQAMEEMIRNRNAGNARPSDATAETMSQMMEQLSKGFGLDPSQLGGMAKGMGLDPSEIGDMAKQMGMDGAQEKGTALQSMALTFRRAPVRKVGSLHWT